MYFLLLVALSGKLNYPVKIFSSVVSRAPHEIVLCAENHDMVLNVSCSLEQILLTMLEVAADWSAYALNIVLCVPLFRPSGIVLLQFWLLTWKESPSLVSDLYGCFWSACALCLATGPVIL